MSDFEIRGLTRLTKHTPNKSGFVILAYFDCRIGVVEFRGCALAQRDTRGIELWEPRLNGLESARRAVFIADTDTKRDLKNAAVAVLRALGGTVEDEAE